MQYDHQTQRRSDSTNVGLYAEYINLLNSNKTTASLHICNYTHQHFYYTVGPVLIARF